MDVFIMSKNGKANKIDEKIIHEEFGKENVIFDKDYKKGCVAKVDSEFDGRMACLRLRNKLSKDYVGSLYESFWDKTPAIEYIEINKT